MKKALCVLLALLLFPASALAQEGPLCVEVMGYRPMVVVYEVKDGKIASFEVVEQKEAPGHGAEVIAAGFDSLIGQDAQSASFDAVSGATRTSNGINGALRLIARGAGKPYRGASPEAAPAPAAFPGGSFSFRNGVTFGMTREQVRALEPGDPAQTEDSSLAYFGQQSAGLEASVLYQFSGNALTDVYVFFDEDHEDGSLYLADFDDVDAALASKYGPAILPASREWSDDQYRDDETQWGRAVAAGDLEIGSVWLMPDYAILHMLYGGDSGISHSIVYSTDAYDFDEDAAAPAVNTEGI